MEVSKITWDIAKSSVMIAASVTTALVTIPYVNSKISKYFREEEEKMLKMDTKFFDTIHERSQQLLQRQLWQIPYEYEQDEIEEEECTECQTEDYNDHQLSPELNSLNVAPLPELNISAIRESLQIMSEKIPITTKGLPPRPNSAPAVSTKDYRNSLIYEEPISEEIENEDTIVSISNASNSGIALAGLIRNSSETKLDWDQVFQQHIKEDIEDIADKLPIVINGADVETQAIKVVNTHIAKRLIRLFRKYCDNKDMLMDESSFERLIRDYLSAAKIWIPKYLQTVTMVKLRYSVAQLQHNTQYDAEQVGDKVTSVIAPYLVECFKVIQSQIDDMSQDDEVAFIRKWMFEQMHGKTNEKRKEINGVSVIDCESFVRLFPTLMESLFEFSKLIPAFRERVSRADVDISLNEHIKLPQKGDDLLDDDEFVERWIMALEEMTE